VHTHVEKPLPLLGASVDGGIPENEADCVEEVGLARAVSADCRGRGGVGGGR
jgi:hypothetical protein